MNSIEELRVIEQNVQQVLMQKQAFEFELAEISNALAELSNSKGDVFKVVGSIMVKSTPGELKKELDDKSTMIKKRIEMLEKQEKLLESKSHELKADAKTSLESG